MSTVHRLALALTVFLAGCAGERGPQQLYLGMQDAPEGKRILFPQPPEVPRFLYAGQLTV